MGFATDPEEFMGWCREETDGEVVETTNEISGDQEYVCVLERNERGFEKEIMINENNHVLVRDGEVSAKLDDVSREMDVGGFMRDSIELRDSTFVVHIPSEDEGSSRSVKYDV